MSESRPYSLEPTLAAFVAEQVRRGRYASAAEVVEAALRLLQVHEKKLTALKVALIEGEHSGPPEAFPIEEFLDGITASKV